MVGLFLLLYGCRASGTSTRSAAPDLPLFLEAAPLRGETRSTSMAWWFSAVLALLVAGIVYGAAAAAGAHRDRQSLARCRRSASA